MRKKNNLLKNLNGKHQEIGGGLQLRESQNWKHMKAMHLPKLSVGRKSKEKEEADQ